MEKIILSLYDYIGNILSVVSIILAMLAIAPDKKNNLRTSPSRATNETGQDKPLERKRKKNRCLSLRLIVALVLTFITLLFTIIGRTTYEHKAIVPDLSGKTYDDAVSALYDSGLTGHLLLASTNENLSNSDSRVVWQSIKPGEVSDRRAVISFVIDDSFAIDTIPLNQRAYVTGAPGTGQVLIYTCDYRDAIHQALEIESEAEQAGVSPVYDLEPPHWYVEVEPPKIEITLTTGVRHGSSFTMANNSYSYYTYANNMAATLYEIAEISASRISNVELSNCLLVGKLIPQISSRSKNAKMLRISDDNSVLFLPLILKSGEYTFVFSLLDSDGSNYEWYHTIKILDID